jgi:hypothetical protein
VQTFRICQILKVNVACMLVIGVMWGEGGGD